MKRNLTNIMLTAGLSALLGTATLGARDTVAVAEIPFAFHATDRVLPAGTYTVERYQSRIFLLYDGRGHSIFFGTSGEEQGEPSSPRLTFQCYGNERALSEIWTVDGRGYSASKSSLEKNLHRKLEMATLIEVPLRQR